MTEEDPFRLFLLLAVLAPNLFCLPYLRRANVLVTFFRRREEGLLLTALISLPLAAYAAEAALYLIQPDWMAWSQLPLPNWLRWLGALPMVLSALLVMWGVHHLGNNVTISVSTRDQHQLITSGPYNWVRHPLYSGLLLGAVGCTLLTANWLVALTALAFWLPLAHRTRLEEQILINEFGDQYRQYMLRVGRYLPLLVRAREAEDDGGEGVTE